MESSLDRSPVRQRHWLFVWGPAIAQMAVIFIASSLPDLGELPAHVSDKTAHFIGYAVLGALMVRALAAATWDGVRVPVTIAAWGMTTAYGAIDEIHQLFVPGRSAAIDDWVADMLGAAAAVAVVLMVASARRRRSRAV